MNSQEKEPTVGEPRDNHYAWRIAAIAEPDVGSIASVRAFDFVVEELNAAVLVDKAFFEAVEPNRS